MQSGTPTEQLLMPERWRDAFDIRQLTEKKNEWILELEEKQDRVPGQPGIILKGFRNPVEVIDFPFRGKPMYLRFFRRRWQVKGGTEVLSNEYEFHPPGMKATHEFGAFLKELTRPERREFFRAFPHLRHLREETLPVVP